MRFTTMSRTSLPPHSPVAPKEMLIGALLRVPAQAIQRRIIKELNAAGFEELRVPHMPVLQFPGPDGARPGVLAGRELAVRADRSEAYAATDRARTASDRTASPRHRLLAQWSRRTPAPASSASRSASVSPPGHQCAVFENSG